MVWSSANNRPIESLTERLTMITIVAKNYINPEYLDQYIILARQLVQSSRNEFGCRKYDLHQDIQNPAILTFIEDWVDEKAIEDHNNSVHYKAIVPILRGYCTQPGEINFYRMQD